MIRDRRFWIGSAITFVLSLVLVGVFWLFALDNAFYDFAIYRRAGAAALRGDAVYEFAPLRHFQYSPFTALAFGARLAPFPRDPGGVLYYVLLAQAWWGALWWIANASTQRGLAGGLVLFALVFGWPWQYEFRLGQVNVIPLLCLFLAARRLDERPDALWLPASLLALALHFKLYAIVFFPILLLRRKLGVMAAAALVYASLCLLVLAVRTPEAAFDEHRLYLEHLQATSASLVHHRYNASVLGIVGKLGGGAWQFLAWAAAIAGFAAVIVRNRRAPLAWHAAVSLAAVPLLMPIAWSYWMVLAYPAVSAGLDREPGRWQVCATAAIAIVGIGVRSELANLGGAVLVSVLAIALALRHTGSRL